MPDDVFLPPSRFAAPGDVTSWNSVGDIAGAQQEGNRIRLIAAGGGPAPLLTFLSDSVFRLRFNAAGQYEERVPYDPSNLTDPRDPSYAVITQQLSTTPVQLTVTDDQQQITVDTGRLLVRIDKHPYRLSVYVGAQLIHADDPTSIRYILESSVNFKKRAAGAFFFGFGEKSGENLDHSSRSMTFFNYDNFGYNSFGGDPLYVSIPLLIEVQNASAVAGTAAHCYALFLDNPSQSYISVGDPARDPDLVYLGAVYGDLNYYFIHGATVPDIVERYTQLTGRMPMPPKYVLGFHQGAYGYNVDVGSQDDRARTRQDVLAVARKYRSNGIPCDGLHLDVDFQDNYRTFTAGPSSNRPGVSFGDAQTLVGNLHQLGFKCSANTTSVIRDDNGQPTPYLTRDAGFRDGVFPPSPLNPSDYFRGAVNYGQDPITGAPLGTPGFYPDLTLPAARTWWGEQYDYLVRQVGLDMVWQDMTDPAIASGAYNTMAPDVIQFDYGRHRPHVKLHNAYAQTMLAGTWEGLSLLRANKRNFIIARGGYAGLQKYAALWTGDSKSEWQHYKMNIPLVVNLGLSGVPISGSDIGGFAKGKDVDATGPGERLPVVDDDLYIRWMTLGAFLPWFRNHYNSYEKAFQEPFNYADPAFTSNPRPDVLTICKTYIQTRYRLLQYWYDCMWCAHTKGLPLARPLFFNFPGEDALFEQNALNTQFMIGDSILVAPQTDNGQQQRNVRLPAGPAATPVTWYPLTLDGPLPAPLGGGQNPTVSTKIDEVPVFVLGGAIIPVRTLEQWVGELPTAPLLFDIYPGPDRTYQLYLDDGITTSTACRVCRLTSITLPQAQTRSLRVERTTDTFTPAEPTFSVRWRGLTTAPKTVRINNTAVPVLKKAAPVVPAAAAPANSAIFSAAEGSLVVTVIDIVPSLIIDAVW